MYWHQKGKGVLSGMKVYWKERGKGYLGAGLFALCLNLYLGVLCASHLYIQDLIYLDLLLFLGGFCLAIRDAMRWRRQGSILEGEKEISQFSRQELTRILGTREAAYLVWKEQEKQEILEKSGIKQEELIDYIAKWSHEAKLPLASLKLMNERNEQEELRKEMGDCIARLETLIHTVMMGSKLQKPEHDVRFEKISLKEAVRETVKNQSYFLIHHGFRISVDAEGVEVYTDKRWLVYLLDQLVQNAVKYRDKEPVLTFSARSREEGKAILVIEDKGLGIAPEDLPYIFEKGFVGRNHRKGDYRSTGMGLYFVREIGRLLHIGIKAESRPGEGCRFILEFQDLREHFLL